MAKKSEQEKNKSAIEKAAEVLGIKPKSLQRRIQRAAKKGELPKLENVPKSTATKVRKVAKKRIADNTVAEEKKAQAAKEKAAKEAAEKREAERRAREAAQRRLYPRTVDTDCDISVPYAPNPVAGYSAKGKTMVLVWATFYISNHTEKREPLRLYLSEDEIQSVIDANSLFDALAHFANSEDNNFFSGIESFERMDIQ